MDCDILDVALIEDAIFAQHTSPPRIPCHVEWQGSSSTAELDSVGYPTQLFAFHYVFKL